MLSTSLTSLYTFHIVILQVLFVLSNWISHRAQESQGIGYTLQVHPMQYMVYSVQCNKFNIITNQQVQGRKYFMHFTCSSRMTSTGICIQLSGLTSVYHLCYLHGSVHHTVQPTVAARHCLTIYTCPIYIYISYLLQSLRAQLFILPT